MANIMNKIKQLREKCGAGISDCKQALDEAAGDLDKAMEILRKKGIAKAAKRQGRQANEGVIKLSLDDAGKEGYMVKITAETDFVARNEKFQNFADEVLALIKERKPQNLDQLLSLPMGKGTVKENLDSLSGTIGEKMEIKQFTILSSRGTVSQYSHMGGRIGVLVAVDKADKRDLAYAIAMQIAASNPQYIAPENVPEKEIAKEKEIYREQLKGANKPDNIVEKIILGKLNKYYEEICLIKQEYIKDDKKKVQDILGDVKVEKFIRYSL